MRAFIDEHNNLMLLADSRKDRDWLTTAIASEAWGLPLQIVGAGNADGVCQHLTIGPREAKK